MRRWRKRIEKRVGLLRVDVNDLMVCSVCWATVWKQHRRLHRQWHEVRDYAEDLDRGPDEVTDSLYGGDGSGDL